MGDRELEMTTVKGTKVRRGSEDAVEVEDGTGRSMKSYLITEISL